MLTSEESYMSSLTLLDKHYLGDNIFNCYFDDYEENVLGNIDELFIISKKLALVAIFIA